MSNITVVSYEDYYKDLASMNKTDKSIYESLRYDNPSNLNDVEQMVASLKNMMPAEFVNYKFDTLAEEKNATGMAYDLCSK